MRLPSYTQQDEKELIKTLSMPIDGPEVIMDAEEYLQPSKSQLEISSSDTPPPPTPIKKFMEDRGFDGEPLPHCNSVNMNNMTSDEIDAHYRHQNYVMTHKFFANNTFAQSQYCGTMREGSMVSGRYCPDPVQLHSRGTLPAQPAMSVFLLTLHLTFRFRYDRKRYIHERQRARCGEADV
jgi:hypothetical protein